MGPGVWPPVGGGHGQQPLHAGPHAGQLAGGLLLRQVISH